MEFLTEWVVAADLPPTVPPGPRAGQPALPLPQKPRMKRIGRYEILARLSAGGFGEVYSACLRGVADFGTLVAVKVLHSPMLNDPHIVQSFADEARLGGRLLHPNITRVMEFAEDNGVYFIVMELVDGVPFTQIVLRQATHHDVQWPTILELVAQAADGLEYAHMARDHLNRPIGLVHRDIKPSNLMLHRAGPVKVMDFGISRMRADGREATLTGTLKGTPAYMAPEAAMGRSDLDHRSDIFSLGVVLFELLSGERLYVGSSLELIHRAAACQISDRIESLASSFPAEVVEITRIALSRNPEERYPSAGVMAERCRELIRKLGGHPHTRQLAEMLCPPPVNWNSVGLRLMSGPPEPPTPIVANPSGDDATLMVPQAAPVPNGMLTVPVPPALSPSGGELTSRVAPTRSALGPGVGVILGLALVVWGWNTWGDSPAEEPRPAVVAAQPQETPAPPTPLPPTPPPVVPTQAPPPLAPVVVESSSPRRVARSLVTINTSPEEQPITIDGVRQKLSTPWRGELGVGSHTVVVGAGPKGQFVVKVEEGKPTTWLGFLEQGVWRFEQVHNKGGSSSKSR